MLGVAFIFYNHEYSYPQLSATVSSYIDYGTYNLQDATIYKNIEKLGNDNENIFLESQLEKSNVFIIPHDTADIATLSGFYKKLSETLKNTDKTVVILGPDHFWQLNTSFASTKNNWQTSFGEVNPNLQFVKHLMVNAGVVLENNAFKSEHSISIHIPFIAKYFPSAKIVPIIISPKSFNGQLATLADEIYRFNKDAIVLASVDFYHGTSSQQAHLDDNFSLRILASEDLENLTVINADSTASLYAAKYYASISGNSYFKFLARTTTEGIALEPFTTHLYGAFSSEENSTGLASLLFVGDVMLDRYVDEAFRSRGDEIFFGIEELAQDVDLFIFNHEGTFPNIDRPQNLQSLFFSFRKEPLEAFRNSVGVEVIAGLANNHSYNFGETVYRETRKNLADLGFGIFGSPGGGEVDELMIKKEINGKQIIIYGYNQFGNKKEKIIDLIKTNSKQGQLDIVYAHWGNEYTKSPSNFQKDLARQFSEAGADLIVGHHPHIVQSYEKIGEDVVFYSLGNFIFDQYFRENTQHGLALKVVVEDKKVVIFPIPISLKQSIPKIENNSLLNNIALYSGFANVGKIEINNF